VADTFGSVTVHPQPIVVNISPMAFLSWSGQYLAAARAAPPGQGFSPVPYFLHGLALELALKAFLLAKGVPRRALRSRRLGHDLRALLGKCEQQGMGQHLQITDSHRTHVSLLNDYYCPRDLEYVNLAKALKGFSGLPDLAVVGAFLDALLKSIKALCDAA
jgi:HEPN domain-containing protein